MLKLIRHMLAPSRALQSKRVSLRLVRRVRLRCAAMLPGSCALAHVAPAAGWCTCLSIRFVLLFLLLFVFFRLLFTLPALRDCRSSRQHQLIKKKIFVSFWCVSLRCLFCVVIACFCFLFCFVYLVCVCCV